MTFRVSHARAFLGTAKSSAFLAGLVVAILQTSRLTEACECGRSAESRIYGGYAVKNGVYPWMARLTTIQGNSVTLCGATMISTQYALTAGHCVPKGKGYESYLSFGTALLQDSINKDRRYPVEKFYTVYKGDAGTDIAVAKLKTKMNVRPICLPSKNDNFDGVRATILGYGSSDKTMKKNQGLLGGGVTVASYAACNRVQGADEFEICAGNYKGGPAFCDGDSGGPLMTRSKRNRWTIIGVISRSYGCDDKKYYGILTRVSKHVDWIQKVTGNAGCQK